MKRNANDRETNWPISCQSCDLWPHLRGWLAIALLLLLFSTATATVWDDLGALRAKYNKLHSFSADHTYTLTDAEHPEKVISVQQGSIAYASYGYRYRLGKMEFVGNASFDWVVYEDIAEMVVQPKGEAAPPSTGEVWDFAKLDALLQKGELLHVVQASKAGSRAFRIDFPDNPVMQYRYLEVVYDPEQELVETIRMAYAHEATYYGMIEDYLPLLTVEYSHQSFDPVLDPALFSEAKYFRYVRGRYEAGSANYQHFQIMTAYE